MVVCSRCGTYNDGNAAFCSGCGSSLEPPKEMRPAYVPRSQFDRSFKGAGPLLKAFIGIIFVLLVVEIFNVLSDSSDFADHTAALLSDNMILIFVMMVISAYSGYASRRVPKEHSFVAPVIAAVLITFSLWMMGNLMQIMGETLNADTLETMGEILVTILYIVFLLVLLLGYIGVVMRASRDDLPAGPAPGYDPYQVPPQNLSLRLHRSRRNAVLFGVCGGMAEYLRTDPLLIRVLWVIAILATSGIAIIAYIILALVLPIY